MTSLRLLYPFHDHLLPLLRWLGWGLIMCLPGIAWGQLSLTYTVDNPPTCGQADGLVTLNAEGGTPPYQYGLVDGPFANNPWLDSLDAGAYRARVIDADLDTAFASLLLSHANGPVLSGFQQQDPTCAEDSSGSMLATGSATWQYSLDGTDYQSTGLFDSLPAGRYSLHVRDTATCLTVRVATLQDPPALRLQRDSLRRPGCIVPAGGYLGYQVQGGTQPYRFEWSHRPGWNHPFAPSLGAGSYTLTVRDTLGCQTQASANLVAVEPLTGDLSAQSPTCGSRADGQLLALVRGGLAPYRYRWEHGPEQPQLTGLGAGRYRLTVRDQNGCLWRDSTQLEAPTPLSVKLQLTPGRCDGNGAQLLAQAGGGSPPLSYRWSNGQSGDSLSGLPDGPLILQVSDDQGCRLDTQIMIQNQAPVVANILSERDLSQPIFLASAQLNFEQQSSGAIAFEWRLNGELVAAEPEFYRDFDALGPQQLILTAYGGDFNCLARDTLTFDIVARGKALLPNVFTPNDDGINDTFRPYAEGVTYVEMEIFDQWGKPIMRTNHLEAGWDGRTQAGTWAQEGVYAYRLFLRYNDGREARLGGSVLLMR